MRFNRARIHADVFTIDSIAITAIHAMKETALEDYNGLLVRFDFTDTVPPALPIRILMVQAPSSFAAPLKRSSVLWALKTFTIELMASGLLYPLKFQVLYRTHYLYYGELLIASRDPTVSNRSLSQPISLITTLVRNPTSMSLKTFLHLQDDTQYQVNFHFQGQVLSKIRIFESILTLLLQLARFDYLTIMTHFAMELPEIEAHIFIRQVELPPPGHHFQQYHAVALLEAVARYYVLRGVYMEMTIELVMDGYLMAWGCVTRALLSRRWCSQMSFPGGRGGLDEGVATN
ncbi:MAG: hypothetical protein Q9178_004621 [Gyalolechia marmorata]